MPSKKIMKIHHFFASRNLTHHPPPFKVINCPVTCQGTFVIGKSDFINIELTMEVQGKKIPYYNFWIILTKINEL